MAEKNSELDLFGEPLHLPRERRGRPQHERTRETSNRVLLMFARGATPIQAARAIGITLPTLHKHYFYEVERREAAALMMESRQLERLNSRAEAGNVSAEKALIKLLEKGRVSSTSEQMIDRQAKTAKPPKLGKKEEAALAAKNAKGRFATRKPPSLLSPEGSA